MIEYVGKRILLMVPVLLGVVLIVFTMTRLSPGDPARMLAGNDASEEAVEALREELGLNDPLPLQFWRYIKGIVTKFDLGTSYQTKRPVISELMDRFPTTAKLALISITVSSLIGITLGIISAIKQNTAFDQLSRGIALLGVSMPAFWAGMMLILVFSVKLSWLPVSGIDSWRHWILPSATSSMVGMAIITRMTRSSMLDVICQDYIVTARAKGLSEWVVITKHALKNALIPIITVLGIQLGYMLGGAVLTESVFSIPGLGKFMVDSIKFRDYPTVQGGVLLLAVSFSLVNLLVDIIYAFVDPRIKSMYVQKSGKKARHKETDEAVNASAGGGN